jgi:hypothetical protein
MLVSDEDDHVDSNVVIDTLEIVLRITQESWKQLGICEATF